MTTWLNLDESGSEWVGRTPPDIGTLEVRFRGIGGYGPGGVRLLGTMRGTSIDTGSPVRPALDVAMSVEGTQASGGATFEGTANPAVFFATGLVTGAIRVVDSLGAAADCTGGRWMLQSKNSPPLSHLLESMTPR